MTEYERSYIFSIDDLFSIFNNYKSIETKEHQEIDIEDYYFDRNNRIRITDNNSLFTSKIGDKKSGQREEKEFICPSEIVKSLNNFQLKIKKNRKYFTVGDYNIVFDFVSYPMKIGILEIESNHNVEENIIKDFFHIEAKSCPLSAFSLFNRKIGICGGPSSGKSETSKILTHKINTEYNGNSFYVNEYATSFIQKYNRRPEFYDQLLILLGQVEREQSASSKSNIMISDSPVFLAYIYTLLLDKPNLLSNSNFYIQSIYEKVLEHSKEYTDVILLKIQNYVDNNIRYQTKDQALMVQGRIATFLTDHNIKFSKYTYNDVNKILDDLFYINRLN